MFMLTMVAISGPLIGICVVPVQRYYYVYIFINLVVMLCQVLSDNMRDESIPTVFGRPNIRITQSFLIMFVGVASLIAGGIQEGVEKNNERSGWAVNLQVGGSFLIIVGVVTATLITLHKKGEFKLLEEADVRSSNEYTKTKDKKQPGTNGETKHESGDDLPKDNDKISMPVESEKLHSDDTQTGNYNRHAMPNRSKSRSTETPNTSSAQASCETERQEHVYGIPSRQSSIKRMNGNNGGHESDRMKSVYGLSPQRQSSKGMINKNVADQIPSDASMHHKKSNHYENVPGFPYAGKSLTGLRQPFPNNDPYKRTIASKTYVEEQMTNAGNPLY
ncbi:uncharacterized protein LOC132717109 [Ruditapes philippinarum]|uniref:uncharacterized protein LOC132717109 n=1 Tax=Ruditapes philippinarum TaxID=129788 RepID=UPI00295ADEBF|nr:uncharacterized protein LOC132717109 [Ruditapes philippinarum]